MAPPVTVDDTVFYTPRNLYLDKPVIVTLLDGSQLEIWGPVFINGNPLATIGSLPIATQPEAEAGVDNTKVMTPLRTKQSITANAPGGGITDGDKGEITVTGGVWTIDNLVVDNAKIAGGAVSNGKLASVNTNTIKGRATSGFGLVEDLTPAQARTVIASDSGGGTTNFLRADATWAAPPAGGGGVTSVNTKVGVVTLNQDEVLDGTTYKQYSQTEKTKLAGIATGATVNSTDATLLARANHTGTQSADTIVDGTTNKTFSAAEDTKLAGIATGATANATDAQLRDRSTHTGTQSADTLTDGTTNKAFLATERTKLTGIATAATANSTDATLLNRANHTGTQSADTTVDGSTNHVFTVADDTKLGGIATGATANSSDATLLARANHTGTQAESTVTNLVTDLAAKADKIITITPTAPLTGGGDLSANRTLDISTFTASVKGAVPPPTTATGKFLKDDGTWATPAGGGGGSVVGGADLLYLARNVV